VATARSEKEVRSKVQRENVDGECGFEIGIAYAAAETVRVAGDLKHAKHLLLMAGISRVRLKQLGVDEFDAKECRKALRS
jgi:hypothetical protein